MQNSFVLIITWTRQFSAPIRFKDFPRQKKPVAGESKRFRFGLLSSLVLSIRQSFFESMTTQKNKIFNSTYKFLWFGTNAVN